jgi:molecular chaperone DnaK
VPPPAPPADPARRTPPPPRQTTRAAAPPQAPAAAAPTPARAPTPTPTPTRRTDDSEEVTSDRSRQTGGVVAERARDIDSAPTSVRGGPGSAGWTEPSLGAVEWDMTEVGAEPAPREESVTKQVPRPSPQIFEIVPQTLGIATVGGYCDPIIARNSQVPCERTRVFTPSSDFQLSVRIRICQGESRRIDENAPLGELVLDGLPARRRGDSRITVTFGIDADGMLKVSARDEQTGAERRASVKLLGAQSAEEITHARERFKELTGVG